MIQPNRVRGALAGVTVPVVPDAHEAGITEPVAPFLGPMVVDIRPAETIWGAPGVAT